MSDTNLPQPLPGAPALRAHLKALERGVADARTQRLGVDINASRTTAPATMHGTIGGMIGTSAPQRSTASPYAMPKPSNTAASASSSASSKPRAARAKRAGDFGAFFDSIEKRAAS
jgi:hypothetical protein